MSARDPRPIAYLTGEYPRATDTFIQREVAALRALGLVIDTCSIRRTGAEHLVGDEQRAEAAGTFHVLEAARNPLRLLGAHLGGLIRAPGRYLSALALAVRTAPPGLKAAAYQAIYFAEAGVLAAHLRRRRARHIHNHIAEAAGSVTMLAARIAGIPFSFTLHGPGIFNDVRRWRLDEKIARARFVACISQYARAQAMLLAGPEHWSKLAIVHCGVTPERYRRDPRAPGDPGKRLLFVGRLAAVKGVPVLLEALRGLVARHPELHLTLIGDGPDRAGLERAAGQAGLAGHVSFTGYLSQAAVAELLKQADLFVLPSFAEGVPVVLMEAMAAGLPVVATAVGGVGELVADGTSGLIVPPGDAGALAAAIDRLLADPGRGREMGRAGAAHVARAFDSGKEAARLAALLDGAAP